MTTYSSEQIIALFPLTSTHTWNHAGHEDCGQESIQKYPLWSMDGVSKDETSISYTTCAEQLTGST